MTLATSFQKSSSLPPRGNTLGCSLDFSETLMKLYETLRMWQSSKEQVLPFFTRSRLDQRKIQIERKPFTEKNVMTQRLMSLSSTIRIPSVPQGTDFNPISYGILKFNLLWWERLRSPDPKTYFSIHQLIMMKLVQSPDLVRSACRILSYYRFYFRRYDATIFLFHEGTRDHNPTLITWKPAKFQEK